MEQIAFDSHRAFFHATEPGDQLPPLFHREPYAALVWATRRTSSAQKQRIAEALIETGCRYAACGGMESESWEDAVDDAYLGQDLPDPLLGELMVMTSSHRGEQEDEVAFFFIHLTRFDEHDFTRYLVLVIGEDMRVREKLVAAIREEVQF